MNDIQRIQSAMMPTQTMQSKTTPAQAGGNFSKMFNEMLQNVNDAQINAEQSAQQLADGKSTDLHQVMIASEKAGIKLQTAVQVRDRAVEAYKEIMRMQV